jgi:tRNA pseudouridine13 synthase
MRWPGGDAAERERAVLERWGGDALLKRLGRLGQGTRRAARLRPIDPELRRHDDDLTIAFTLPRGAYATVVLRELLKPGETAIP